MIQSITNPINVKVKQNQSKKNNTKHKMIIKKINRIKKQMNAKEIKRKLKNEPKKKKMKKRKKANRFTVLSQKHLNTLLNSSTLPSTDSTNQTKTNKNGFSDRNCTHSM